MRPPIDPFGGKMKNAPRIGAVGLVACSLIALSPTTLFADELASPHQLPNALSASDLSELSGGASPKGVAVTTQVLSASNSGNTINADSLITGDVTLQSGAFSGFNGVGNFVFNTGNNNNLQGTLSVTIVTAPVN